MDCIWEKTYKELTPFSTDILAKALKTLESKIPEFKNRGYTHVSWHSL